MCQDLISTHEANMEINKEHCTPFHENDDSDKSVVEETPQKYVAYYFFYLNIVFMMLIGNIQFITYCCIFAGMFLFQSPKMSVM